MRRAIGAVIATLVILGALGYSSSEPFRTKFLANRECCKIPLARNVSVTLAELFTTTGSMTQPAALLALPLLAGCGSAVETTPA